MDATEIREVVYRFGDAPVPPPHHRSYEIRVTAREVRVRVDSYGDVLSESAAPAGEAAFRAVVDAIARAGLRREDLGEDDGCVGGTSQTVIVRGDGGELLAGTAWRCGGRITGTLAGDVDAFADAVRALVPDLARRLA